MTYEDFQKIAGIVKEASKFMDIKEVTLLDTYDCVEISGDNISIDYDISEGTVNVSAGVCVGEPHIEVCDLKLTEMGLVENIKFLVRAALLDRIKA